MLGRMADDNEHGHDHGVHGFGFPLPPGLADVITGQRDRQVMGAQVAETEVQHFLDGLDVGQLLALRRILCMDNDSSTNNYFDGQVVTLLRVVHKVDAWSGKPADISALDID